MLNFIVYMVQEVISRFKEKFSYTPLVFRSPGRINIIGEHTDYNGGFVLPAAINKEMYFAIAHNTAQKFRFYANDLNEYAEFDCEKISRQTSKLWTNYLLGILAQLEKIGIYISGVDVVVGGTIPIGAGISSSAAMECGFLYALNSLFTLNLSTIQMVKMSQMAEHEYAGVKCGIMDQFAVMFGKKDQVIKLDCRSLEYSYSPLELKDYTILLCDSVVKHSLASSEYNIRRTECEEGVRIVSQRYSGVETLRDVTLEQLLRCANKLSESTLRRCSYVIEENIRLENTCAALAEHDYDMLGKMIYASHEGLQKKYNVSCDELDILVDIAYATNGVLGARMMGGGFGGCTINIVHNDAVDHFIHTVQNEYYKKYSKKENIIPVGIADGTSQIS